MRSKKTNEQTSTKTTYRTALFFYTPVIALIILVLIIIFAIIKFPKNSIETTKGQPTSDETFIWGDFKECSLFLRSNINIPPGPLTLTDRSEVVCGRDKKQTLITVTDKPGFNDAKNSIYRIWKDSAGYKVLLVDANGAGSGEGVGKLLLIKDRNYILQSCFYYLPEDYSQKTGELTYQEMLTIKEKSRDKSDPYCSNFRLFTSIE